jgi:hypothetical protein
VEALRRVAALRLKERALGGRFHAFGHDPQAE